HYAKKGAEVTLICATLGEAGMVDPRFLQNGQTVAGLREQELRCSAEALGLKDAFLLGYRDSGMQGSPDNTHPQALAAQKLEDVVTKIAQYMRALQPDIVLTFDPFGGYGHPLFTTEEMLERLYRIGLYFVAIGIQTGSEHVNRDIYNRRIPNEKIMNLAWSAKKVGVSELVYDVLTNNPYETEEDCRATLELLLAMPKPSKLTVSKLVMFPQNKILELTVPKVNLPETVFDCWNLLYLMSASPLFTMDQVRQWSNISDLHNNPSVLEKLVVQLCHAVEEKQQSEAALDAERSTTGQLRSELEICRHWKDRPLFERAIRKIMRAFSS
ncbi:MAG TPA: PIG-L family deacetylase, partial [bacterium]|nr:PIG-L family deacetylase [bacterium]